VCGKHGDEAFRDSQRFYDGCAEDYEDVTGGKQRLEAARAFVDRLRQRVDFDSALDVACGTGVFTIPLAQLGVDTVGTDLSSAMLDHARDRARTTGLSVSWVAAPMQELAAHLGRTFDLILCMGNSLPHLLTPADLARTLSGFSDLLNPGGHVVVHLLNYTRILNERKRIVGATREGAKEYVRFYDFLEVLVRFNILEIDWTGSAADCRLRSTMLYPYQKRDLDEALATHQFTDVETWGSLGFEAFDPDASDVLLTVARRSG